MKINWKFLAGVYLLHQKLYSIEKFVQCIFHLILVRYLDLGHTYLTYVCDVKLCRTIMLGDLKIGVMLRKHIFFQTKTCGCARLLYTGTRHEVTCSTSYGNQAKGMEAMLWKGMCPRPLAWCATTNREYPPPSLLVRYITKRSVRFTFLFLRQCYSNAVIGTASANSAKHRGIRPRMYIEDLLWQCGW